MTDAASTQPSLPADRRRPAMAFRIGITGTRAVASTPAEAAPALRAEIVEVLQATISALAGARRDPRGARCYDPEALPALRCLSPLAEGADQLFAALALEQQPHALASNVDLCLEAAIPFAEADYQATFSADRAAELTTHYTALAGQARCGFLELDGEADEGIVRTQSYEAVGQTIVRNADLIIALWDDTVPAKGRGGTRDIVQYALKSGVPVWWINPEGRHEPRFLEDEIDLWGRTHEKTPGERRALYVQAVLQPPQPHPDKGWFATRHSDPLLDYLDEPLVMNRNCWLLHAGIMGSFKRLTGKHHLPPASGGHAAKDRHFVRALFAPLGRGAYNDARLASAQLSGSYQHRYRTSYLAVLVLGAIALGCAVLSLSHYVPEAVAAPVELVCLLLVAMLVVANSVGRWHEKYISFRLLSELARPGPFLNALGWTLPFAQMRRTAGYENQGWTAWLAAAHARAMPMASGNLHARLVSLRERIISQLINPQIDFHRRRHAECEGASAWLSASGLAIFVVTLVLVILKVLLGVEAASHVITAWFPLHDEEAAKTWVSALTALGPALSALLFGLSAYEELEPLAELSGQMLAEFKDYRQRIEAIDLSRPLASQVLAEELLKVAGVMLSEVSGWAELFRSRAVDA